MENKEKVLIEVTEQDLTFLFECVTVVSKVKWKGYNSAVEPLRQMLKAKRNDLIQARIDGLQAQIKLLEESKNEKEQEQVKE